METIEHGIRLAKLNLVFYQRLLRKEKTLQKVIF